jgi:hypothetical protein
MTSRPPSGPDETPGSVTISGSDPDPPAARRWVWRAVVLAALGIWVGTAAWHAVKPLAPGVHVDSAWMPTPAADVAFLADSTAADAYGQPVIEQTIVDEMLRTIAAAQRFIVLDVARFNAHARANDSQQRRRQVAAELTAALVARRASAPRIAILVITDPVNEVFGAAPSPELAALREAGVQVAVTDLGRLRDPNLVWTPLWRLTLSGWAAATPGSFWNPVDTNGVLVSPGAWAQYANFKANGRGVLIADDGEGRWVGLVMTALPEDASSADSAIALRVRGAALAPLLASELAIARFSGWKGRIDTPIPAAAPPTDPVGVRTLTEGAIADAIVDRIGRCTAGDAIDIAVLHLADRDVLDGVRAAAARGARVRVLLDPNGDAYGRTSSGLPNRPVASELVAGSEGAIRVRWYRTHGEQFRAGLVAIRGRERFWLVLGAPALTRRAIRDYNLAAALAVDAPRGSALETSVLEWFERAWDNRPTAGLDVTADHEVFADPNPLHYWGYRIIEATGVSTF